MGKNTRSEACPSEATADVWTALAEGWTHSFSHIRKSSALRYFKIEFVIKLHKYIFSWILRLQRATIPEVTEPPLRKNRATLPAYWASPIFADPKLRLDMGAAAATLNQGMGLTQEEYILMSHSPRPLEASDVGSHVKSTPEWLSLRKGGSENPELWLSPSGIMAQFAPDYSLFASIGS